MFICVIKNVYLNLFFLMKPSYIKKEYTCWGTQIFFQEGQLPEMNGEIN